MEVGARAIALFFLFRPSLEFHSVAFLGLFALYSPLRDAIFWLSMRKKDKKKGGNSHQRAIAKTATKEEPPHSGSSNISPIISPLEQPKASALRRLLVWEGIGFVFVVSIAFAMLELDEYNKARWFFIAAAIAAAMELVKIIDAKRGHQRFIIAILASVVAGLSAKGVNNWVTSREITAKSKQKVDTVVIIREQHEPTRKKTGLSTEPSDRANLHVVNIRLRAYAPNESLIKAWTSRPYDSWLFAMQIPETEAVITVANVGRYRALVYVVRTAIIVSEPLGPGAEDPLFKNRTEWQAGGLVSESNYWYPGDAKEIHVSYNRVLLTASDWPDLLSGKKVFYVVTKAIYQDKLGGLPETESCSWMSMVTDKVSPCWGHNN